MTPATPQQLRETADKQADLVTEAAKRALGMDSGPEKDRALAGFFCRLMDAMGMGYHPDGFDAAEITYGDDSRVWPDTEAAEAVTRAHDMSLDIVGLDPYDAFTHANVINDLRCGEDKNDPETYAWHLQGVADIVETLAPGWEAIPAEVLNASERRAESGILYDGPWVFHPKGDGGDTDPALSGEFWETLCKLTA